ncbi:MAG: PD-(D/E)XK nuclease family protein [Verrucomicrobiae bacterium]|nr:PD-(D/E)XK nuclease family protein [Verrucomicrobiae bacterium]
MQARFLLGPAGSGKTFRCLGEIRAELARAPEGPSLLLLAPKQATFQLERQLLGDGTLAGYTRLQILSFERLARFLLTELSPVTPEWLDDEGRVMVLRALLARERDALRVFHATARLPGFATRLSLLLRELQRHQISPERLTALADRLTTQVQLRDKLHDFAHLLRGYLDWLGTHGLQDANCVLDVATALLRSHPQSTLLSPRLKLGGLWLDGFAEMTAQELDLLAALVPHCDRATLAFCLETELPHEPSWLSSWSVIGQTFLQCRQRIEDLPDIRVEIETLGRDSGKGRFVHRSEIARLEECWANPPMVNAASDQNLTHHASRIPASSPAIFCAACANPEAEATLAAREIRRFVRAGGRFRETAVLVRALEGYADTVRRVFARYEIPCFLDRREPVAHHPLAELTRYALRTVAFNWRQPDWFGALKTGLVPARDDEIDWLENLALEFGWEGQAWRQPLAVPDQVSLTERAEGLRQKLVPPFVALAQHTAAPLNGQQFSAALRELWQVLEVESTLEAWSNTGSAQAFIGHQPSAIHATVWDQMQIWRENLERAFPDEALSVREWLPILEAGLASLTVGVLPPALDQVLVGAIDRSRNPDLKLALVLGLNEGVFPARPVEDPLLNEVERIALASEGAPLWPGAKHRIGHEWFYGYIACTRASQRLVLTCAQADARGNPLNRSPFFDRLERIFPGFTLTPWQPPADFADIEHLCELTTPAIQLRNQTERGQPCPREPSEPASTLLALPELADVLRRARDLAGVNANQRLSPEAATTLYGREPACSISGLENFASCPFKFFVSHGLRAEERKRFELDSRERGSFQHEVLTVFHNELMAEQRKWRDVLPDEARARVRRIGQALLSDYRHGLFGANAGRRFEGEALLASLETLIAVLVGWARNYQFDPALVETGFGLPGGPWPAWRIAVDKEHALLLRGRIDRVDLWRDPATGAALAVVMDYKSSSRTPDRVKLYHGLQLQLPAYLAVVESLPEVRDSLGVSSLAPVGVFYVNLRGEFSSARSRVEALADAERALRLGFQHAGRYDETFLERLDPGGVGEQFKTSSRSHDRMNQPAFRELLNRTVENLRRFGREIFSGRLSPEPFRKGTETACDWCEYAAICRFDPWTQPFRALPAPPKPPAAAGEVKKPKPKRSRKSSPRS